MRPASDSILSAIERTYISEDRLTEVLACVATVNTRFAAALVGMAGVDPTADKRYAVGTQRGTPSGRRVDMEIAAYDELTRTKLVWLEVKAGADYQPDQLPDYAKQVQHPVFGEPDGRVLTIIPPWMPAEPAPTTGPRWETRTWSEVALAADRLGRDWGRASGRPRWREFAMEPEAPAQWRYLAELVQLLEEKGLAQMEPLTPEDVIAAQRHVKVSQNLRGLRRAARQGIDGVKGGQARNLDHWAVAAV